MNGDRASRPKARLPRGFRDGGPGQIAAERRVLDAVRGVYESYGFDALETPAFEYTDALGKFLPDLDRPNEGVFSIQDDDGQWLSLRYDLTAPLARYVAENFQTLPKPYRRYQIGTVWRNEKPGPGRFRQFTQCDADTVGTASRAADAEAVMMLADAMEAAGLKRGDYVVKLNSRQLLEGVLDVAGVSDPQQRGVVLRAIDKLDRLGVEGVRALLGKGRKDESGDITKGAELDTRATETILSFVTPSSGDPFAAAAAAVAGSRAGDEGAVTLADIQSLLRESGYGPDRVQYDPGIVRGLDYYTGAVFEAQLTFPVTNEAGETVVFGSVGSGGRYDGLVARFLGQLVPATGVSVGVSRLISAARARGDRTEAPPLIVVLVLDKAETGEAFALVRTLRAAGLRAEAYVGESGMKAQLKYADKRGAALAIIEGSDERARGEVTVKDLALGAELSKATESRADWVKDRPAQQSVKRAELVPAIKAILAAGRA